MELKGINSCQTPLINNSKIITSSTDIISNVWCPSSFDNEPYLLISLSNLTYITRLNIKTISSNIYYHLEYTRDNLINHYTIWHSYRLLNNKHETIQLDPPIIVKYIRLNIKQMKINSCFQLEIFGCIFTDGVVSYSMLQGNNQLEDDTYDGQYNIKHRYLYDGLGQLSDGQTGPDDHEDLHGFQWVGWRKSRSANHNHSIEILFKFDTLRNFSRITIHANNYYPKKIYVFRSVIIEFLNYNNNNSSSLITYNHQRDDQFEMARPIMIDLKYHIASQLKIHLYFDGNWILISEVTFDSFIVPTTLIIKSEQQQQKQQLQSIYFSINIMIICIATIIIILVFALIISLTRCLFNKSLNNKKTYFTPIHNHTDSSASTTSSEIDIGSSHHRYATIGSNHPYLIYTNGNISSSHYSKFMSTTTLLRSPSKSLHYHIEGVCGNSSYGTQRLFSFDLNQNQFIPSHKINIKRRIDNRHQILGGGEICQGELQLNQSLIPITIRRLLPNASVQSKISFFNEISLLTSLCHPNIIHAYGFCSEPSISLLIESSDISTVDLYQYLQNYKQEQPIKTILYTTTVFFATQISSALTYLESLHIYHRDLAARNCLVSIDLNIKLHDLAMCNEIYADDYVLVTVGNDIQTRRPIRWCAWETICLNRFTSKSDVFSFGVLLWEILTMAERPHSLLDDEQVLFNLRNSNHCLTIPSYADDLIDLILSCWNKCDYDRPSFYQLNHLLSQKQQQQQQFLTMKSDNYQQID
ncbi:unnamed protein product [Rotaria sp. Silwood1]|nr:unnamed protein product [Rotaria sp. Silwood1]CAF1552065.1 unnamed protein product [Rotaria sp. Silwood1]CAF3725428.1 unnamed protein product [Rotaria sp. Silwood1]CAF4663600.1 unnamed protein product [Rotaria sp. Silwood1]